MHRRPARTPSGAQVLPSRAPAAGPPAAGTGERLSWSPLLRVLTALLVALLVIGPAVDVADDAVPEADGPVRGVLDILERWLTLDAENTAATWFSLSVLLLLAVALAVLGLTHRAAGAAAVPYWVLAAAALYLSVDEGVGLHEQLGRITGQFVSRDEIGTFTWVVPGLVLAVVVGALLLRLARGLPPRLRLRLVVAGVVYLAGALVAEAASGTVISPSCETGPCLTTLNPSYIALNAVEEGLEMAGALLALRAVLLQLRVTAGAAGVAVTAERPGPSH